MDNTNILNAILTQLKKIKNQGVVNNAIKYDTDLIIVPNITITETQADSNTPLIDFVTPNEWVDMVDLSFSWDSTTASNYAMSIDIDSIENISSDKYIKLIGTGYSYTSGTKIRLQPSTHIRIRAYNYGGTTSNGVLFMNFMGDTIIGND